MMKSVFTFCFTLLCSTLLHAQFMLEPSDINRIENLRYTIQLECDDALMGENFEKLFLERLGEESSCFQFENDNRLIPDVIFRLIAKGKKEMLLQVTLSTLSNHVVVFKGSEKKIIGDAVKALNRYYFSGMPPQYSTLFENGQKGYVEFRIPAVTALPHNKVIVFAEARAAHIDCAENDIVARVSDDGGYTWGDIIVVAQSGTKSLNNPVSVYLEEKKCILLIFQEYPPKLNEGNTATGLDGENITRTYVTFSYDDGKTWTAKRDITAEVKLPVATGYATGPGVGIRVEKGKDKGRILIPVNVSGGRDGWFNYLVYSDDLGESWNILEGRSSYGTNESQIVEIAENEFIVNARCHKFEGSIHDRPVNWGPWNFPALTKYRGFIPVNIDGKNAEWGVTEIRYDQPDPLCQGSILRYSGLNGKEKSRILVANPASNFVCRSDRRPSYAATPPIRINGVVRVSYDDTKTWDYSKRIYGNRYTEYQYSVLTNLGKGKIGCVFEASTQIRFAVFDMRWLTSDFDKGL